MKRILFPLFAVIALVLGMLTACASNPAGPALSLDDQIGVGIQEVTAARKAATQLLVAKKITVAQDQQLQAQLDAVRATMAKAQGMSLSDPAQATALLAEALTQLATLQAQGAPK